MADERPELTTAPLDAEAVRGAVVVGVVPDQNPRVVKEAAKYAAMMKAPLVVASEGKGSGTNKGAGYYYGGL